ncbi:MAG: hypothetical protein IKK63_11150 [Clostridia bacterium]|nr:hypothetical protein [Clostridia bacterium]
MSATKKNGKKKVIIILAIIAVIIAVFVGVSKSGKKEKPEIEITTDSYSQFENIEAEDVVNEVTNDVVSEEITDVTDTYTETNSATETTVLSAEMPATKEDIVAFYNNAANRVKNEAKKITRNFKNTRYDTNKSVLPSALESMANPMVEKYVKDDVEPVEYLTKEEIIENYPAPKQTYSSKLTAADVDEATCVDNGKEYVITLKLASCKNPSPGVKVGAACHIMDVNSITSSDAAKSMLNKFDAVYSGCVIKCKIDKATNRVTWANFYTPFVIDADINVVFSNVIATIYMSYERDYTITY